MMALSRTTVKGAKRALALRSASWVALSIASAGCAETFTEPWQVKEPRLMGARIEVEGAAERSRPRLDERFSLRQYVALPGPHETPLPGRYAMDAAICIGLRTPSGELACLAEQELDPTVTVVSDTELLLTGLAIDLTRVMLPGGPGSPMELPTDLDPDALAQLAELDRLALFGVFCVDGRAERVVEKKVQGTPTSQLFRCVGNEAAKFRDPTPFTISVLLDRGRGALDQNRNPSFSCDPAAADSACSLGVERPSEARVPGAFVIARPKKFDVEGREVLAWPARDPSLPLPWRDCAGDETLPKVQAGAEEHTLRVRFDPSDREQYQYEIASNGAKVTRDDREALLLTHALSDSGGRLARFESKLNPDESEAQAEISFGYTPPKQSEDPEKHVPELGRLVRFYFTVRDERGGVDFTTRELCLVPPP
jgi:hypothetical protein